MDSLLILPDQNLLEVIKKDLEEDSERLERHIELFKEWLRCEPHLPKDVDGHLIQTFVRSCKCDLEKSKRKFENFLSARIKLKTYYTGWNFDENFFKTLTVHKQLILCPELTPKGYRVMLFRYPRNVDDFVFKELMRYMLFLLDYLFYEDISAGFVFICDLKEITAQHIARISIGDALKLIDLIYNISPLRTREIHFLHLPTIAEALTNLVIKTMSQKLQKRVQFHKIADLPAFIPKHIVPEDYSGTGMSLNEHGDMVQRYFMKNKDWIEKTNNLKLSGPVPANKKDLYSFEEFEMEGTFRTLSID